jgi:DNA-directed RNA polymerase specialized sigma24 family protein
MHSPTSPPPVQVRCPALARGNGRQLRDLPERLDEVLFLDRALQRLKEKNPRQAQVVELRYFGGLSVEQMAAILEVAPWSVKRDWSLARMFLYSELRPDEPQPAGHGETPPDDREN